MSDSDTSEHGGTNSEQTEELQEKRLNARQVDRKGMGKEILARLKTFHSAMLRLVKRVDEAENALQDFWCVLNDEMDDQMWRYNAKTFTLSEESIQAKKNYNKFFTKQIQMMDSVQHLHTTILDQLEPDIKALKEEVKKFLAYWKSVERYFAHRLPE